MKILHVITSLWTGGAEHLMVDLLPGLRNLGNEVDLAVLNGTRTTFYEQLERTGIRIIPLSEGGSVYNPLHIVRLKRLMRNYDVVHTHNTSPQFFAAIASKARKQILITTEHSTSNRRRYWKWFRPVDRWLYNRYDDIIFISEKAKVNFIRFYGNRISAELFTILNGIDVGKFANATAAPDIVEDYGGFHTVVMVAGFRDPKDQPTLIKAFKLLPADYHLLLVGEGARKEECLKLSSEYGLSDRVHFLGVRADVQNILKACDIVVMSSHYEGLSLSSIEGMASGKPFVASDVDGLREVTEGYGIIFPHKDEKALADIVRNLIEDESYAAKIAARCRERAWQYDMANMVKSYDELYRRKYREIHSK